jgi:hypothetical protein
MPRTRFEAPGGRLPFSLACCFYVNRYTMQHVPDWALVPLPNGKFPAPHFRSDAEWYANTVFPGEPGHWGTRRECFSTGQTWPKGQWLDKPYKPRKPRRRK